MPKGICCNLRILKCVSNDVLILFYEQNFLFLFRDYLASYLIEGVWEVPDACLKRSHAGDCRLRPNYKPVVKSV